MSLFGRRKPGFSKEVKLTEEDLSGEFSDRNDPAMMRNSNPKEEKTDMAAMAQKVMGGALYDEPACSEAAPSGAQAEGKIDIFDYMESLPDVADPFPPSEPEPEADPIPEKKPGEVLAEYIRERSRAASLTPRKQLMEEDEEMEALIAEMQSLESCADIQTVKGQKDEYFYSSEIMANNYAMIAMLVYEKDIATTVARMVTFNCKTYPCPTPLYYFTRSPYFYTAEEIQQAVKAVEEKYETIHHLEAMNGEIYLYDEAVMSFKYARALANEGEAGEADF